MGQTVFLLVAVFLAFFVSYLGYFLWLKVQFFYLGKEKLSA